MGRKKNKSDNTKPFVSICTPTFNRRPFIPAMIECFNHQTYPKDRIEWIILDDGTDKIEELVIDMMQSDLKLFERDRYLKDGGHQTLNYYE